VTNKQTNKQTKTTNQPQDDPQIPQSDLRFAAKKQQNNSSTGPGPNANQKRSHKGKEGSDPSKPINKNMQRNK
jgi:hypothetical protein